MSQVDPTLWPVPTTRFSAAYQSIAMALLANAAFNSLVKLGNLNVWCDGRQQELLQAAGAGNLPEVTLLQTQHLLKPWGTSSRESCAMRTYGLVAVTDTLQIATINAIEDAVMGALYYANLENNAVFAGVRYIRDVSITGGSDGTSGIVLPTVGDSARGINRQSGIITIAIELYWPRSLLPI